MTATLYGTDLAHVHIDGYSYHADGAAAWVVGRLNALRDALGPGLVVDLGCGGGPLLRPIVDAGHPALGVDISPAMVAAARARVPEAEVRCASIADVELPPCHAVLAVGEALNYLATRDEQRAALAKIHDALAPGGLLVFDLRLPAAAQTTSSTLMTEGDGWVCVATRTETPEQGMMTREIVTFVREGGLWRRSDETHRVLLTGATTVLGWLHAAGLDAHLLDGYGDYVPDGPVGIFEATRPA